MADLIPSPEYLKELHIGDEVEYPLVAGGRGRGTIMTYRGTGHRRTLFIKPSALPETLVPVQLDPAQPDKVTRIARAAPLPTAIAEAAPWQP